VSGLFAGVSAPVRNDDPTRNDGTSVGFELVGTPAIFGFFGYLADRALGTAPIIMLVSAGIAFVTVLCLVIWRYNNDMDIATEEHKVARESRGPGRARWERGSVETAASVAADVDAADLIAPENEVTA
jgi:hypothetical protein